MGLDPIAVGQERDPATQAIYEATMEQLLKLRAEEQENLAIRIANAVARMLNGK